MANILAFHDDMCLRISGSFCELTSRNCDWLWATCYPCCTSPQTGSKTSCIGENGLWDFFKLIVIRVIFTSGRCWSWCPAFRGFRKGYSRSRHNFCYTAKERWKRQTQISQIFICNRSSLHLPEVDLSLVVNRVKFFRFSKIATDRKKLKAT